MQTYIRQTTTKIAAVTVVFLAMLSTSHSVSGQAWVTRLKYRWDTAVGVKTTYDRVRNTSLSALAKAQLDTIAANISGGGSNFANTDLTQTGNRNYNAAKYAIVLDSCRTFDIRDTADVSQLFIDFTGVGIKHLKGATSAPTIIAGVGAGTSPTVAISGDDLGGYITITTGTTPTGTNAIVATITYNKVYSTAPKCIILTPANNSAKALSLAASVFVDQSGITTTKFDITSGATALGGTTTFIYYYLIKQ